jgi:hypothetical protein
MTPSPTMTPSIFRRLAQWLRNLFRYEPIDHAHWELLIIRIALALLIVDNVPRIGSIISTGPRYDSLPSPSGIAEFWPWITQLSNPEVFVAVKKIFWIAALCYIIGIGVPFALTYMFLVDICLGSLDASQGAHGHSRQALSLSSLGQTLAVWTCVFWTSRGGWRNLLWWSREAQNLSMNWARQMVCAAYAVSAVTKEMNSAKLWFLHSESFALSTVKAQRDAIAKGTNISQTAMELGEWLVAHPVIGSMMLLPAWLLEMSAPLMMLNRRIALILGVAFWIFHKTNGWLMGLPFACNRSLIVILFISFPWWGYTLARKVLGLDKASA